MTNVVPSIRLCASTNGRATAQLVLFIKHRQFITVLAGNYVELDVHMCSAWHHQFNNLAGTELSLALMLHIMIM